MVMRNSSRAVRMVGVLLFGMLSLIAVVASAQATVGQTESRTSPSPLGVSQADKPIFNRFARLPGKWNLIATPLIRDYIDSNVDAAKWAREAPGTLARLKLVHLEMSLQVAALSGAETRKALQAFVDNYGAKLDALEAIVQAISQRDPDSERQALEKMNVAAGESRQLVASLVARLSPAERLEFSQALAGKAEQLDRSLAPVK